MPCPPPTYRLRPHPPPRSSTPKGARDGLGLADPGRPPRGRLVPKHPSAENFTRPRPTLLCLVLAAAAVYPLTLSMPTIPVGTAYAVFTGIGAAGAVTLGIQLNHDPLSLARMTGLSFIVAGVIVLRLISP